MCGICGIMRLRENAPPIKKDILIKMRDILYHRGPDDAGIYIDEWIGLGSRRLCILDLSEKGHMPMSTEDGRYWIVHNGEIYNYKELQEQLKKYGFHFRSNTDTEVLLYLYSLKGPDMLRYLNGMFAFAIWDTQEKILFIARDRLGIKPLYYTTYGDYFYFASEEKALLTAGVPAIFDEDTLPELLYFRYVAGERTPYKGIYRLLPGHYLLVKRGYYKQYCWWSLEEAIQPISINFNDAVTNFNELLDMSISYHRISDVPVGVLLSGGLDSSSIAAKMAIQTRENVPCFNVRFQEPNFDEGPLAKELAQRYQLDYHEFFVTPDMIPRLIEEATWLLDEPLVHGNDVHLLAISRYAKSIVTVLLSGEGADEFLGGYVRYKLFLYPNLLFLPKYFFKINNLFLNFYRRWRKIVYILNKPSIEERILFSSAEVFPEEIKLSINKVKDCFEFRREVIKKALKVYIDPIRQVMYYDQHTYLQSILDRNDRMTMGASIECRVPYLDCRLIEWVASLPTSILFKGGKSKSLLRQAMYNSLPLSILNHQKWGFGVPWHKYLREIPIIRNWIQKLPQKELIQIVPLSKDEIKLLISNFLLGEDRLTPIVRQLFFITLWYEICIQNNRHIFS